MSSTPRMSGMTQPLIVPFLINAELGDGDNIPTNPTHLASWSWSPPPLSSSSISHASHRVAIASDDASLWIVTISDEPVMESLTSTPFLSPISPTSPCPPPSNRHPSQSRHRAASSASSILSNSSRRKALSPPPSASLVTPATQLSSAMANPVPSDAHRSSFSDRVELLDHLREQRAEAGAADRDRHGLGLGIAGIGRRNLHVHGKEELDGTSTPRSTVSSESVRTISGRLFGIGPGYKALEEELREKMDEVDVQREMDKEVREEAKEQEDQTVIERATKTPIPEEEDERPVGEKGRLRSHPPVRVFLGDSRSKITKLKVMEKIGSLVVLRDVGLLDLVSLKTLNITHSIDLERNDLKMSGFWEWSSVHLATKDEYTLLIVAGRPWPSIFNPEITRVLLLSVNEMKIVTRLDLPGVGDIGVCSDSQGSHLLHATATSLTSYPIIFPHLTHSPQPRSTPRMASTASSSSSSPLLPRPDIHRSGSLASIRAANKAAEKERDNKEKGFAKFIAAARRGDKVRGGKDELVGKSNWGVGEGVEVRRDGGGGWSGIVLHDDGEGLGMSSDGVDAFTFDGRDLTIRGTIDVCPQQVLFAKGLRDVAVFTGDEVKLYSRDTEFSLRASFPAKATCLCDGTLFVINQHLCTINLSTLICQERLVISCPVPQDILAPFNVDELYIAKPSGSVHKQTLEDYVRGFEPNCNVTVDRLDSPVSILRVVGGEYVVAGDEDGVVRIWRAKSFELCGSWTLFADPVDRITLLSQPESQKLQNCLLCTSLEGTVGIISLTKMDFLFLIPAARAPLKRIFIGGHDILLAYANGKARVWNVETQEFRRSTGLDAAEDMVQASAWFEVNLRSTSSFSSYSSSSSPSQHSSASVFSAGPILQLNLREFATWLESDSFRLSSLNGLLSVFLTFGVNEAIDEMCSNSLGAQKPTRQIAVGTSPVYAFGKQAWQVSPELTGLRQLAIISLLLPFLDAPNYERVAADVIAYYSASLPDVAEPDLGLFADHYMDGSVQQAARMLFRARLAKMGNEEVEKVVESQQSFLPSVIRVDVKHSDLAARALVMVGGMAIHRYQCINPTALRAVADSLSLYLHDDYSPSISSSSPSTTTAPSSLPSTSLSNLPLAIEICSKGFAIWQSYVDPSDLLRRLFHLATHKETAGAHVAAQARLAVLHVASSNPALFMSTLSMDILEAKSAEGRNSIMKLCVFMARKRPVVLENGLPRIAEAVVKSLDPNLGKMRDDVWQAATVILNEFVLAFSTIDFHPGSQKLAVGTHEGAVIMYDLKTASRLYVLEPHKKAVSAVTFSPDGRRLVTVSIQEGAVTVWKIGSSISGLFMVGGPPRQGQDRGEPFKRITFIRVDDEPLESTTALSDVEIEWTGQRHAKVTIKQTALSFET